MADDRTPGLRGTPNGRLIDDSLHHDVLLHRHAVSNRNDVLEFLNDEAIPDLEARILYRIRRLRAAVEERGDIRGGATIVRLNELHRALVEQVNAASAEIASQQSSALSKLGVAETAWAASTLTKSIPVRVLDLLPDVRFDRLPLSVVDKIIRAQPFQGKLLTDHWSDLGAGVASEIERQVKLGMVAGDDMDQIAARIFGKRSGDVTPGVVERWRREADTIARTSVMDVANAVRHETFVENDDVVAGEKWIATLDTRTCPSCGLLDGEEWDLGEPHARPPLHFRCRCTLVAITSLERELKKRGLLDDLPPSTRASMTGPVPETVRYPDWLGGKSSAQLDEILGPGRAAVYRRGKVGFDEFAGVDDRPLTLAQLLALEASRN